MRFFRTGSGTWRTVEPWMSCVTDLDTGAVIGVFDSRDAAALRRVPAHDQFDALKRIGGVVRHWRPPMRSANVIGRMPYFRLGELRRR